MAEQGDETSDDGFPHDDSHAEECSSERSSEDKDTIEVRLRIL